MTSLLLSETTDSQFNCERSLRNFSFENFEEAQVTIFGDYIFSPNELQTQNWEKWSLMSESMALKSMQKTLSIFTSFVTEEVYVGIGHYINRFT